MLFTLMLGSLSLLYLMDTDNITLCVTSSCTFKRKLKLLNNLDVNRGCLLVFHLVKLVYVISKLHISALNEIAENRLPEGSSPQHHQSQQHRNCHTLTPLVIFQIWHRGRFDWTYCLPGSVVKPLAHAYL